MRRGDGPGQTIIGRGPLHGRENSSRRMRILRGPKGIQDTLCKCPQNCQRRLPLCLNRLRRRLLKSESTAQLRTDRAIRQGCPGGLLSNRNGMHEKSSDWRETGGREGMTKRCESITRWACRQIKQPSRGQTRRSPRRKLHRRTRLR